MTRDMDPLTLLLTNTDAIVEVKAYWQFVSAWLHVNRHVCSNEVLFIFFFTRYTIVMIYYAFSLLLMMLARPIVSYNFTQRRGTKSIYAALYFHPVLIVLQAVLSGLLCKSFTSLYYRSFFLTHLSRRRWASLIEIHPLSLISVVIVNFSHYCCLLQNH